MNGWKKVGMMRPRNALLATIALMSVITSVHPSSAPSANATARCNALAATDFSDITDAPVRVVAAKLMDGNGATPAHCEVTGSITPYTDVEVRLPVDNWNGKFLAIANVSSGAACDQYLKRGYACMPMFRTFKKGQSDAQWASALITDLQARIAMNRGPHLLTLAGKGIVSRYYSSAPDRSYFLGCSAGGHSAMVEAQTFPWDYDGIVAGAPNLDTADWLVRTAWAWRSILDENGQPILSKADFALLHRGVLASCDSDDGLKDGIVSNPLGCRFAPSHLVCAAGRNAECLTPAKVAAIERIYAGPGASTPNMLLGSECQWGVATKEDAAKYLEPYFKLVFDGSSPQMTPANFDFEHDRNRTGLGISLATPNNPDLRKFKSAGGKLIGYLGTYDAAYVTGIIDYYETVERTMGGRAATQEFFRFFLVPGMTHCTGGQGAYAIDYLAYLEAWVERNQPPDSMVGANVDGKAESVQFPLDPAQVNFTRPVYPYPLYAKYRGAGNPNDAASFVPVDPRSEAQSLSNHYPLH